MEIIILGSTGSVGSQTLEVCESLGLPVAAIAARSRIDILEKQIRRHRPRLAVVEDAAGAVDLRSRVSDTDTVVEAGRDAVLSLPTRFGRDVTVVAAMSGVAGLEPCWNAVRAGLRVALANKETLVTAGDLIMNEAKVSGAELLPVDSEHSAIWQCLRAGNRSELKKILLTASGGPFYGRSFDELEQIAPEDALRHPNWSMGPKITVDSATLMNKGLEFIEAMKLYGVGADEIEVLIHRESIVHSAVEFADGAVIAQLASPDMKLPIEYALTYPARREAVIPSLSLAKIGRLTFAEPDETAFPCLRIARDAVKLGTAACAVMNGANEAAVAKFLSREAGFNDIPRSVERAVNAAIRENLPEPHTIGDVIACDRFGRERS